MSQLPTVLIVDDHFNVRRLLVVTLNREFHVLEAENGIDALSAVRKYRPFAVLLDVMMPGEFNGIDILKLIKAEPDLHSTLVAMVSARGQMMDQEIARKYSADAYFVKPFSPNQVVTWLRNSLIRTYA